MLKNDIKRQKRDEFRIKILELSSVILGELLKREPWQEVSLLEQFLGIDVITTKEMFVFNNTKGFYCHKIMGKGGNCEGGGG